MRFLPSRPLFRLLLPTLVAFALLPGAARAQSQPSLAEQAAAARGASNASLDPQVAGHVVEGEYRNDYFGLQLKPLPGWETLNRGQMNVQEAMGRDLIGLKAGVDSNASGRVFGMHDGMGASVFLSIRAVPPGTDTSNLESKLQAGLKSELPEIHFSREPILLGDSSHRFDAFRASYVLKDVAIAQTLEYILCKGHLIALTVTAPTPEKLTAVLHDLQSRLQWTSPAGQ